MENERRRRIFQLLVVIHCRYVNIGVGEKKRIGR
jgi:hypothetical protein